MTKDTIKEFMKEARLMRNYVSHCLCVCARLTLFVGAPERRASIRRRNRARTDDDRHGAGERRRTRRIRAEERRDGGREAELHDRRSRLGSRVSSHSFHISFINDITFRFRYLHTKQCIHRDVAARNCLYANKTVSSPVVCGKLLWRADFMCPHLGEDQRLRLVPRGRPLPDDVHVAAADQVALAGNAQHRTLHAEERRLLLRHTRVGGLLERKRAVQGHGQRRDAGKCSTHTPSCTL